MNDPRLLAETVETLVRSGPRGHPGETASADLERVLAAQPPDAVADLLEHADVPTRDAVFAALEPQLAGEVAAILDDAVREELIEDMPSEQLAEMLAELEADEALPILEDADPQTAGEVLERLAQVDPEEAGELRELLGYREESAGRAMAFGAPAVRPEMSLAAAIDSLRAAADELDEIETVFVVDGEGRLLGYLPPGVLILRPPETRVGDVMRTDVPFAYTHEDQEQAVARAHRAHVLSIPVVDERWVLRGQIPHDRLVEIEEEETSEDMYRMAGLSEDESVYSSFGFSLKKRLPWLALNLGTAILAAWIISFFEATIAEVAILAALQSIVAGQGGNAGIQTLTITVRGLALGELDWRNARRTFLKELGLGAANGLAIGAAIGLLVALWRGNPWLGLVIATAMLFNMIAAAAGGFCVPLILRALKQDPAQASGVFVTTVTDVCGFFFFLGLATLCLPLLR